ncbi:hypothetical protein EVAR_81590_1 [Eumeta japonica]|uniref:Uncharacterized protein n=1 Tax=Eumeta variegata TaxID=151549 RepID=A0A4C1WDS3_EUMVA|nr:hypothetical protein EVAR_81590_1 [Eumeta japonica]
MAYSMIRNLSNCGCAPLGGGLGTTAEWCATARAKEAANGHMRRTSLVSFTAAEAIGPVFVLRPSAREPSPPRPPRPQASDVGSACSRYLKD